MTHERHLSLVIPDLFSSPQAEDSPNVAELKTLLARSTRGVCATHRDALLFEIFGFEYTPDKNLPVASITHALHNPEQNDDYWLRADPVYMRTASDRVMMMGNDFLAITRQEAALLGQELAPLFDAYGLQLTMPEPKCWYLRLPNDPGLFWHALSDVRGHDIHQYLPVDIDSKTNARLWRRLLNEAQMLLHDSTVNHARIARGQLPVNSLWFWGGGTLPHIAHRRFAQVWGNDALTLGMAKFSATPHTPTPISGCHWLQQATIPGRHLVIVEAVADFTLPDETDDGLTRKNNIESLNRDWFSPLLAALKSRQLASLHLYTCNGTVFQATPKSIARWWKRPRSLSAYQAQLEIVQ
ncbi:MAG: hypothetical protein ABIR48_01215 [Gammaproteobacteria bacterium]